MDLGHVHAETELFKINIEIDMQFIIPIDSTFFIRQLTIIFLARILAVPYIPPMR